MTPFLKKTAQDLYNRFETDIEHCALVFNNKRPAAYMQKYLADIFGKPFFGPSFFTIQEFFSDAVEEKIADHYMQFFTLHKIYNALLMEEGLPPLKSSQFYPLAKIILSDFSQIDNDLVDADKLYKELEDISVINLEFDYLTPEQYEFLSQFWASYSEGKHKKQQEYFIQMWRRMPKLYHGFHAALQEKNMTNYGGAYRKLAGQDIAETAFIKKFEKGKIIFVGFNALTRAEAQLFTRLQEAGKARFYFDTDDYYFKDTLHEAGLFLRKNMHQLQLKSELEEPFQAMTASPHAVDVYKVQGQSAQAKVLSEICKHDYATGDAGTTAIVLADENLLIPALQTIPSVADGKEVNLNVTMGFPFAASSVFGLANLWLNCQQDIHAGKGLRHHKQKTGHISWQRLESFLTHPLIYLTQARKDKIRTAILKENVVLVEQERITRQGGILEKFFAAAEPGQIVLSLTEVLQHVLQELSSNKILKDIDARLFVSVIKELNRLHDNVGDYLKEEELPFIISLVQKVLQGISVPLSGDPLEGIQLMGLLETRNLNFDHVVLLGFNEGIIPKISIGNSFIPDSLRRVHGLPILENLDAISAYIVYRLFQGAEKISIVYNSLTDETASGEASRFLKQLEYESNFRFSYYELESSVKAESRQQVIIDKKHPAVKERLLQFLNKERTLSPTAITTYIANPIDFFFSYIAGIKEPKEVSATVEANEIGSILHDAMDSFYSSMKGKVVTKEWITLSRSSNEALIKKSFCKVRELKNTDTYEFAGMQLVVLAIVSAYIDIILDQDEAYAPFTITGLEENVNAELPFELNGTQQSIRVKGIIDRIDEKNGVTRIVDYKTGSDKLEFNMEISKLFDSNDKHINKALIQTMIYTHIYEQTRSKTDAQPVLYVVKTMKKEGIYFRNRNGALELQSLAELKPLFMQELGSKLAELFDENIPFRSSELPDNYTYSIYKTLFGG